MGNHILYVLHKGQHHSIVAAVCCCASCRPRSASAPRVPWRLWFTGQCSVDLTSVQVCNMGVQTHCLFSGHLVSRLAQVFAVVSRIPYPRPPPAGVLQSICQVHQHVVPVQQDVLSNQACVQCRTNQSCFLKNFRSALCGLVGPGRSLPKPLLARNIASARLQLRCSELSSRKEMYLHRFCVEVSRLCCSFE